VAVQAGAVDSVGVEAADGDAKGVVLGRDDSDERLLGLADGPVPIGSLLSRLIVNRMATAASTATTPTTIHVTAGRRRSGSEVIRRS
jgi:hypothetical protein